MSIYVNHVNVLKIFRYFVHDIMANLTLLKSYIINSTVLMDYHVV